MAYITKRGSSYGIRYTYQDEQGKNCNKWESFSTKEEATNRKKQIEHELANGTFLIPSTEKVHRSSFPRARPQTESGAHSVQ